MDRIFPIQMVLVVTIQNKALKKSILHLWNGVTRNDEMRGLRIPTFKHEALFYTFPFFINNTS